MSCPGVEQTPSWPERRFPAPSVGQALGFDGCSEVILVLVLGATLLCALGVVALALAAQGRNLYGILAILGGMLLVPLSVFSVWFCLLTFGQGRVVLQDRQFVEHGHLGRVRRFGYDQVYALRQGRHANQTVIRYYARVEGGRIDRTRVFQHRLVSVHHYEELRAELQRRLAAPQPDPRVERRFLTLTILWPLAIFGLLLVIGLVSLALLASRIR